jgi:hypothetical protein
MPIESIKNFMDEFAKLMETATSVNYSNEANPRGLFAFEAIEDDAADVYSVLVPFGGSVRFVSMDQIQIQCMTIGKGNGPTMDAATKMRSALFDDQGRPLCHEDTSHYRIIGVTEISEPGIVGRDEKNRPQCPFNFTVGVAALADGY